MTRSAVSVLLVDDDIDLLDSLEVLVTASPRLRLAGRAASTHEALQHCQLNHPEVVLADIRMPGPDGLTLTRALTRGDRRNYPRVLVTTAFPLDEYLLAALGGGASGFLAKGAPWPDVHDALLTVADGGIALPPTLTARNLPTLKTSAILFTCGGRLARRRKCRLPRRLARRGTGMLRYWGSRGTS